MAAVSDEVKNNMIKNTQGDITIILDALARLKIRRQEAIDLDLQPGGADGITDTFLQTQNGTGTQGQFPNLSAADITNLFATVVNIDSALAAASFTPTGSTRVGYKAMEKFRSPKGG